ncbi:Ig-like domain-containing protein [Microbulbifer sp. YPW1]|uniref:Ig-like domain-containing protein n=1 Tax=Microbulbifer sp. YPW1 TaxID=2745199 RepID=UPI001598C971|nr:Ig-like domain-containing protein [Microbulbifer sp. YPW1]QKX15819.1 Ig-like domain-containing protein [Microbulbifer sp. YPW1]
MSIKNKHFNGAVIGALSLVLVACGGGSSGGGNEGGTPSEPTNQPPSVSADPITLMEGESATITASATDPEGSSVSYMWEQKAGASLTLGDVDTATVSIQAPAVVESTQATLVVTVTDAEGATTSEEVVVSITARMVGVSIAGVVTESLAENSEVSFNVGEQLFTTVVGSAGQYSTTISVDDSLASEMVRAEVRNPATGLKLVSLMGDFSALVSAAGEDGVVVRDELPAVNISTLTTALAAQVERGEPGSVETTEQLTARKKLLNGSDIFHLGTLIRLVLDHAGTGEVVMPDSFADTYALAADREAASRLINEIQTSNASIYQAAVDEVAEDAQRAFPSLAIPAAMQDTYYFDGIVINPIPFSGPTRISLGNNLNLNAQGSGTWGGNEGTSEISWEATTNGLEIAGAEFVVDSSLVYDESLGVQIQQETVVQPKLIKWLDYGEEVDWFLITADRFTRYPNGEYPPTEAEQLTDAAMGVRSAGAVPVDQALQMGLALSIPLPLVEGEVTEPTPDFEGQSLLVQSVQLTFAGNIETGGSVTVVVDSISGAGVPASSQVSTSWALNGRGHLLIDNILGYEAELVLLESDNLKSPLVFVALSNGVEKLSTAGRAYLKEAPAWTADRAVGIYTYPMDFNAPHEPFWFEVNADGTALTVSTWDRNGDGEITSDEVTLMPGFWTINEAGNLLIRRYFASTSGFCEPATWDPAPGDECALYHEREWVLHQDGEGIALRHYHRVFADPFLDDSTMAPEEHVLSNGSILNTYIERVAERPAPISSM